MTTSISPRMLEVQLMVDHPQLQSAELEKLLTLPADEHWDVGDVVPGSKRRYQFSRWALRTVANSLDELSDAIQVLTQRIRGIEQKFDLLPNGSTVGLTLFVTETNTVIGMGIDAEAIKLLARINAGIEVSLVVTTSD
ncbi:MAG: DUF4279 domain-containing protein [Azoarcus sp.]|nr:DUF4279 domain-containing protein [Azoarcus sp.]